MSDDDLVREMIATAEKLCELREALERRGRNVELDLDWQNGLTPAFQLVRCWKPIVSIDGITVSR